MQCTIRTHQQKKNNPTEKWGKKMNRYFLKELTQINLSRNKYSFHSKLFSLLAIQKCVTSYSLVPILTLAIYNTINSGLRHFNVHVKSFMNIGIHNAQSK